MPPEVATAPTDRLVLRAGPLLRMAVVAYLACFMGLNIAGGHTMPPDLACC
jgi:hypothetical protein